MDGKLQKLIIIVGHGGVAAAPSAVIIRRYFEHRGTHLKRRCSCGRRAEPNGEQDAKELGTWSLFVVVFF